MRANAMGVGKTPRRGGRDGVRALRRLATSASAAAFFLFGVVGAARVFAQPVPAPQPSAQETAAAAVESRTGWLKTFAAAPIDAGARFDAPDYYGSLVEEEARQAMRAGLLAQGLLAAEPGDANAIIFSIRVDEPKPATKRPPQSRLRLESVETDPTDNIRDPEVRPFISLGPSERAGAAATPMIAVTIYARRGDARIWSGYAAAPPDGAGRAALARALAGALVDRFGESADIPQLSLTPPAAEPGADPVQNGLSE